MRISLEEGRRRTLVLAVCCLAQFMVILDISVVNVALPSIAGDLGFTPTGLQWVVNAYTLTFGGFLLLGGRATDLLGRRGVFVGGLLLFTAASLAGGLAQNEAQLVAARALQGLGGALVAPASLSILTTTFTEGAERNRALGFWGAMGATGGSVGVVLGGVLTDSLSWRWVLLINVPLGLAVAAAALLVVVPGGRQAASLRDTDLAGALTITAGLTALTYGIVGTESHGWGSAQTLVTLAIAVALLATFVLIEARLASRPLVPLRIFRVRSVTGGNIIQFCLGAAAFAMYFILTLYLQGPKGLSPLQAGLCLLPMSMALIVCARAAGALVGRFGVGAVLTAALVIETVGLLWLSRISADGPLFATVLLPSILAALGYGFGFVPVTIAGTSGVRGPEAGLASGLLNTSRQIGASLGLALTATVAASRTAHVAATAGGTAEALTAGYQRALLLSAAFTVVGAVASVLIFVVGVRDDTRATTRSDVPG